MILTCPQSISNINTVMEKLTLAEHIGIGTALRLSIHEDWNYRRSDILRNAIKQRIQILRKLDKARYVYLSDELHEA